MGAWMPHRIHVAGLLAIACPWLFPWWPAALVVAGGVFWLRSVTATLALLVAVAVYWPGTWPFNIAILTAFLFVRYLLPPGSLFDSIRSRFLSWGYLVRTWYWLGRGPGSARLAMEHAFIRSGERAINGGPVHNEWLELAYEYGLFAVVPMLALFGWGAWHVRPASSLWASLAAAVVVLAGTSPLRDLVMYLRGGRPGPLYGPPLLASLTIHLDREGRAYLYFQPKNMTPELHMLVGEAMIQLGHSWLEPQRKEPSAWPSR